MFKTPINMNVQKQLMKMTKRSMVHERLEGMDDQPEPVRRGKANVSDKIDTLYKAQIPKIAGNGRPNMEIANETQRDLDIEKMGGKQRSSRKLTTGLTLNRPAIKVVPEVVEGSTLIGGTLGLTPIQQQGNAPYSSGGSLATKKACGRAKPKVPRIISAKPDKTEGVKQLHPIGNTKKGTRNEIVKRVMQERGMTLPQASAYVKEKGLY